jgi:hypothetical protein
MSNAVMPENTTGIAIGDSATSDSLPPIASIERRNVEGVHVCAVLYVGDLLMRDAQEFCHLDLRRLARDVAPANSYPH